MGIILCVSSDFSSQHFLLSSQLSVPGRPMLLPSSCRYHLGPAAASYFQPPGACGVRPPTGLPAAAPPHQFRLPRPTLRGNSQHACPAACRATARSHCGAARALEAARWRASPHFDATHPPTSTQATLMGGQQLQVRGLAFPACRVRHRLARHAVHGPHSPALYRREPPVPAWASSSACEARSTSGRGREHAVEVCSPAHRRKLGRTPTSLKTTSPKDTVEAGAPLLLPPGGRCVASLPPAVAPSRSQSLGSMWLFSTFSCPASSAMTACVFGFFFFFWCAALRPLLCTRS